jgi:hypothetical protein
VRDPRPPRPLAVLAAGIATALAAAAPASATEGPSAAPPPSWGSLTPPALSLPPAQALPAPPARTGRRPAVRRARITPRHVKHGRRAVLRLTLSTTGKVKLTITRTSKPHRGARTVRTVSVRSTKLAIRLPRRAAGRYRVAIVAADAQGTRSKAVRRSFTVRSAS